MFTTNPLVALAAALLLFACSSSGGGRGTSSGAKGSSRGSASKPDGGDGGNIEASAGRGDDAPVVPDGLSVTALAGGNGVLDVVALTLRSGPSGAELYAALKNDGDVPACDAALAVELFDRTRTSIAAGIGALFTQHLYRLSDGSGTIAACVGPGDVAMAAVTDLPSDIAIDRVGYVVYRCPYFALDVVPTVGLTIESLARVPGDSGMTYTGTLVNGLEVAVSHPSVTVFPLNRAGRPLGAASAGGATEIPPGGSWSFETSQVDAPAGDRAAAYPAGAFADHGGSTPN